MTAAQPAQQDLGVIDCPDMMSDVKQEPESPVSAILEKVGELMCAGDDDPNGRPVRVTQSEQGWDIELPGGDGVLQVLVQAQIMLRFVTQHVCLT